MVWSDSFLRRRHKIWDFFKTLLLLGIMALGSAWLAKQNEVTLNGAYRVIDGDSLIVNGQEIRLLGIDAPEYQQNCTLKNQETYPCGKQSRTYLSKLVQRGSLECTGSEKDKYQRLLAICSVGELEINQKMVHDGWAVAFGDYEREEGEAQEKQLGVWQGGFESPSTWREQQRDAHSVSWLSQFSFW